MNDHINDLSTVKVLPSPFGGAKPTVAQSETLGEKRSWPAKGKPQVNSVLGHPTSPRPLHQVPTYGRYFAGIDWFEATLTGEFAGVDPEDVERPVVNSVFEVPQRFGGGQVRLIHDQMARRNRHYRFGFHVLLMPQGAKLTNNRAALLSNYRVGSISAVPHKGNNCLPGSSIFQVENALLYRSDLWTSIDAVFAALDVQVSHITRLDPFVDGHALLDPADDYFRDTMDVAHGHRSEPQLSKVGKATFNVDRLDEDGRVESFYIGTLSSKKALNGYAKGRRIDIENKQYIREAWRQSGLIDQDDDGKAVARLEMRHKKKALDELHLLDEETGEVQPFDWRLLRKPSYLVGLIKETLRNFYGFKVVSPTNKDKSSWDDVPTLDWDGFDADSVIRIGKTRKASETWKAKHTALKIIRDDAATDYMGEAVRREIRKAPDYDLPELKAQEIVQEITRMHVDLDPEAAKIIVQTVADKLATDAVEFVTSWTAASVPTAIAWAIAEEHNVEKYIEYRIRQDVENEQREATLKPLHQPGLTAAA